MRILSAKETKATVQKKLIAKKNLFGLGLTSLIAACSGADEAGGGGITKPPAGPIGTIPENPVPAGLTATEQLLAETSIEKLAPVADIDSDHISTPMGSGARSALNDLVVTIDADSDLVASDFTMTFKNGNHNSDPLSASASVYELVAEGTNDLVVTSADFGDSNGTKKGAIYIVWDIGSRENTTLTDTANNNFLKIEGLTDAPIGQYAPEFFHIGGDDNGDPQYDMVFGGYDGGQYDYLYILWDVAKYADTSASASAANQSTNVAPSSTALYGILRIDNSGASNTNIAEHSPEFLQIGDNAGDNKLDMVIRAVGDSAEDTIHILWNINQHYGGMKGLKTVTLGNRTASELLIGESTNARNSNIAKNAPEFLHIGGEADKLDMVIRSEYAAGDNIYILWDVGAYFGVTSSSTKPDKYVYLRDGSDVGSGDDRVNTSANKGLLEIAGEKIGKHSPDFAQIGGVVDTNNKEQHDMVIRSDAAAGTGAIYVLWDVAAYYDDITIDSDSDTDSATVTVDLSSAPANGLLKITGAAGENIGKYDPEFFKLAGIPDQHDMVIRSEGGEGAIYVLWDIASYYSTATTPIDLSNISSANHGLLKITGSTATGNIGQNAPDILKINNNDDYDMIIKSDANMYILWDFAKYGIFEGSPANVDINLTDTANANGLLTISGAGTANILKDDNTGFADIDGKGINDIVFTDGGNTFILFGEKIAYRDANGKAVSDTVNLTAIKALNFDGGAGFFTADKVTTVAADAIGYRYANDGHDTLAAVQGNPPSFSLSDADAGVGVWDIA